MLGDLIRAERERLGLSQSELSRRSGVSPSHISLIEAGKRQSAGAEVIEALARALGVTTDYLLSSTTPSPRPPLPGTEDMPKPLADLIQRLGRLLTEDDYRLIAAYGEGLAARRNTDRRAYGYQEPIEPEPTQQVPKAVEDDENTGGKKSA